ncbi:hypothetical protein H4R19_004617 [Coemansia spiralis]|nr:hypothetical protein H4R19_004617 [Coemansia spiralis]
MYVADLTDKYPQYTRRVKLYSYGQPKSGNEVFADYMDGLDAELIRVVNKGDTAPHLPRNDDIYKAFGTEVWINYSNRTVVCRAPDYSACSDSVSRGMQNVPDHSLYPGL